MKVAIDDLYGYLQTTPTNGYLNLEVVSIDEGFCKARMPFNPNFTNANGAVHGGALMTCTDLVFFLALATLNGLGREGELRKPDTSELKINFLAPCFNSDIFIEARVIKNGRSLIYGDVSIFNDKNVRISHATVTYFRKNN
ncbi:MAG: PaaI family thioesterase [Syntrophomonadaceae bacterium]|jgi:uncharacterized protein (TIGR00369 family)